MKAKVFLVTLIAIAACGVGAAQGVSAGKDAGTPNTLYIQDVTVIDTESGKEIRGCTVVIAGERIRDVNSRKGVKPPLGARVVDGRGKFLIPGLWDMHVHANNQSWYAPLFPLYLANGVTGIREMFGPADANAFRAEVTAKKIDAPHIYMASPIVDGDPPVWSNSIVVKTPEEARKAVDEQKQRGADFIKVYNRLSRETYFAIMEESKKQHIPVAGHVPSQISAWEATAAKQTSFEHLSGVDLACSAREDEIWLKRKAAKTRKERADADLEAARSYSEEKCQRLFHEMKKNGTRAVPTLTVDRSFASLDDAEFRKDDRLRYFSAEFRDWLEAKDDFRLKGYTAEDYAGERELLAAKKKMVGAMFRAEVPILAGTDVGNPYTFPGFSLHDELSLLVESGLTPLAALQAATRNAAVFMGAADKYGSITPGMMADLVLLEADPLKDIQNTKKISEVFLGGKEFSRQTLDTMLKKAEADAQAK